MKREQIISLFRHLLSGAAGILIARGIVNESVAMSVIGSLITLSTIAWSIYDKTFGINQWEGALRQILTTVGLFVAFFNETAINEIVGFIATALAIILGQTSKVKTPEEGSENK